VHITESIDDASDRAVYVFLAAVCNSTVATKVRRIRCVDSAGREQIFRERIEKRFS